jgi:Protein of unknown function (DUF2934)
MENSIENEYPAEATVGDQGQRGELGVNIFSLSPAELHQCISQLAHQLYLRRGKIDGYDLDDWLVAESKVLHRFTDIRLELGEQANGEEI